MIGLDGSPLPGKAVHTRGATSDTPVNGIPIDDGAGSLGEQQVHVSAAVLIARCFELRAEWRNQG
jgi:hypothetical protein